MAFVKRGVKIFSKYGNRRSVMGISQISRRKLHQSKKVSVKPFQRLASREQSSRRRPQTAKSPCGVSFLPSFFSLRLLPAKKKASKQLLFFPPTPPTAAPLSAESYTNVLLWGRGISVTNHFKTLTKKHRQPSLTVKKITAYPQAPEISEAPGA